ncbi:hypothetical protein PMZ80_007751 [Knufia obscura]|uniref:Uncharacterized protein n=2 Tax=Knufia TaxID=430999 RepID=A0AAN8ER83_9EURO|nr:hypothetical protein PMZ80_007751 [Knufia obscura]KAK5954285.1 hypothetical protein OHC33_004858 [Knufia fluminis]
MSDEGEKPSRSVQPDAERPKHKRHSDADGDYPDDAKDPEVTDSDDAPLEAQSSEQEVGLEQAGQANEPSGTAPTSTLPPTAPTAMSLTPHAIIESEFDLATMQTDDAVRAYMTRFGQIQVARVGEIQTRLGHAAAWGIEYERLVVVLQSHNWDAERAVTFFQEWRAAGSPPDVNTEIDLTVYLAERAECVADEAVEQSEAEEEDARTSGA